MWWLLSVVLIIASTTLITVACILPEWKEAGTAIGLFAGSVLGFAVYVNLNR